MTIREGKLNIANVQSMRCIASYRNGFWYGTMKSHMEENFRMEWNMEWKKIAVWIMEKLPFISFQSIPCSTYVK